MSFLRGSSIQLRTVRQADLGSLYEIHHDIENRGSFFPVGVMSEAAFRDKFNSSGFWDEDHGMLLIIDDSDAIVGHVEFFRTVPYLDELELSYQIYSPDNAGKGLATQAVDLLTGYLFDRKKNNRIRLVIHPENLASKRIAEKCGYQHEGIARGAWFHRGRNHDVDIYSILRAEFNEGRTSIQSRVE